MPDQRERQAAELQQVEAELGPGGQARCRTGGSQGCDSPQTGRRAGPAERGQSGGQPSAGRRAAQAKRADPADAGVGVARPDRRGGGGVARGAASPGGARHGAGRPPDRHCPRCPRAANPEPGEARQHLPQTRRPPERLLWEETRRRVLAIARQHHLRPVFSTDEREPPDHAEFSPANWQGGRRSEGCANRASEWRVGLGISSATDRILPGSDGRMRKCLAKDAK